MFFEKPFDIKSIKNILNQSNGCKVIDERKDGGYITPLEAENSYLTFISRIRKDSSNDKAINMWVVSDNLLKGAALNTVQIAEQLIKKKCLIKIIHYLLIFRFINGIYHLFYLSHIE